MLGFSQHITDYGVSALDASTDVAMGERATRPARSQQRRHTHTQRRCRPRACRSARAQLHGTHAPAQIRFACPLAVAVAKAGDLVFHSSLMVRRTQAAAVAWQSAV